MEKSIGLKASYVLPSNRRLLWAKALEAATIKLAPPKILLEVDDWSMLRACLTLSTVRILRHWVSLSMWASGVISAPWGMAPKYWLSLKHN